MYLTRSLAGYDSLKEPFKAFKVLGVQWFIVSG